MIPMKRYTLIDIVFFIAIATVAVMFVLHWLGKPLGLEIGLAGFFIWAAAVVVGIITGSIRQLRQRR